MKVRFFSLVMVLTILFHSLMTVNAMEVTNNEKELRRKMEVDTLREKRIELCLNFQENEKEIQKIDHRLEELGCEEVSFESVKRMFSQADNQKYDQVLPFINPPSEYGIKWISNRYVYVYRGKMYEIQELQAVAEIPHCSLSTFDGVDEKRLTPANKRTKIISFTVPSVAGLIPKIGAFISGGMTVAEAFRLLGAESQIHHIKEIAASYSCRIYNTCLYDFVKPYGVPDEGRQILGYGGNEFFVASTLSVPGHVFKKTGFRPKVYDIKKDETVSSPILREGNRFDEACKNVYNYKERNIDFWATKYLVQYFDVHLPSGKKKSIRVPFCNGYY